MEMVTASCWTILGHVEVPAKALSFCSRGAGSDESNWLAPGFGSVDCLACVGRGVCDGLIEVGFCKTASAEVACILGCGFGGTASIADSSLLAEQPIN